MAVFLKSSFAVPRGYTMYVFVTLGTQKFQFNRLLSAVDRLAQEHPEYEIFAQTGRSDYVPQHYKFKEFLDKDEFEQHMDKADIVVAHGGTGAIIGALKKHKRVLAVPRKEKYGEHVDDHQKQIVQAFEKAGYIKGCMHIHDFERDFMEAVSMEPAEYKSNTEQFAKRLKELIDE